LREIQGGVCAPAGFSAGGVWCGIKADPAKKDLALLFSDRPCAAAAVFTTNIVQSSSVRVARESVAGGALRAAIANSGNANACSGEGELAAARRMADLAASALGVGAGEVAVASTGVIGVPLPIGKIEKGMAALAGSLRPDAAGHAAALDAIMTTDTRRKEIALELEIGGAKNGGAGSGAVRIGGMAKGSGMIHPNMATMLCFLTTDAKIEAAALDRLLRRAAGRSFGRVTVDGDTSTNDMALIMASGASGAPPLAEGSEDFEAFALALERACAHLAREIARDGEGATRLLTVSVSGAESEESAERLARAVASSSLVKAACHGADANWGRVLCAMGYSGARFDPSRVGVRFRSAAGEVAVCAGGAPLPFSEAEAAAALSQGEIEILIECADGGGEAAAWGCDLTCEYVKINGDYRS